MGKLKSTFKTSLIEDIKTTITNNNAIYYVVASNPVEIIGDIPSVNNTIYDTVNYPMWSMIHGKRLRSTDIVPLIKNIPWESNTIYTEYNDKIENISNTSYYVVTEPDEEGGYYHIFKCISSPGEDIPSVEKPDQIIQNTFTKTDGYSWRYIYSISSTDYNNFSTTDYIPVYTNTTLSSSADEYSGVDKVEIVHGGNGYSTYTSNVVQGVVTSTQIQLSNTASNEEGFYEGCAVYFYNNTFTTGILTTITDYSVELSGKIITLENAVNTSVVISGTTNYIISPRVDFDTDGEEQPSAFTQINAVSNSISNVYILDTGSVISRADATVFSPFGSGANLHCVVSQAGGHGADPSKEFDVNALGIYFTFANTESDVISTDILYNKLAIIKNPNSLTSSGGKGTAFSANAFNQMLRGSVTMTFDVGDVLTGQLSGAKGIVAFSNSSTVYLVGDKHFSNNETVESGSGNTTNLIINSRGSIYVKDMVPLYVENTDNVERASGQSESFRLIIQV